MPQNAKHEAFAREYLLDLNGKQAAIRAGYSPKSADVQASKLLANPKVQALINALKSKRAARVEVKADDVLRELKRLSFSDIADVFDVNGQLRAFRDIPKSARRAISAIKVKSHTEPGDEPVVVWTTEIKLWDKPGSLGMLGKHLKLFTEKVELSGSLDTLSDDHLAERYAALVAKGTANISGGAGTTANAASQSKGDDDASLGPDGDST